MLSGISLRNYSDLFLLFFSIKSAQSLPVPTFYFRVSESMGDHPANLSRAALPIRGGFDQLVGQSAAMQRLYDLIRKASQTRSPVLLLGETGTGKELVARCIHFEGLRHEKPFVPIDCSALSPTLVESELFGHVKGAFTDAAQSKRGLIQAADEGSVFLDEIGELPVFMQAKFLRVLQEKEIRPVGSTEQIPVNVRVIAATNRDLEAAVRAGTFRQDLFFRLNVIQIELPPLREHKIDIPLLAAHFLEKFSERQHQVHTISEKALRLLMAYQWPGNIRELQNTIERAVVMSARNILKAEDLAAVPNAAPFSGILASNELLPLAEMERRAVMRALEETGGDKLAAARLLGIGKTTLYRRLKEYSRISARS